MISQKFNVLCIALLALSALTSCGPEQTAPLRIGTNTWLGYEPLYLAREKGYIDAGAVKLIEFTSNSESISAFRNNAIEAACLTFDEALAVRTGYLRQNGATVRSLLQGWFDALDYLEQNPGEAARIMTGRQGISAAEILKSLDGLHFPRRAENKRMLLGEKQAVAQTGENLVQIMLEQQLLGKRVDVSAIADSSCME